MSDEREIKFGDRVYLSGVIRKMKVSRRTKWDVYPPPARLNGVAAVVIGKRTLREGKSYFDEYGSTFVPEGDPISAYLVAYDMHRNPVHCLPEQITVIAESESK